MSKRFTVTVPDAIGQVVERAAEAEGAKAATTASFMLETAIREGLQSGKYPKEWAVLEKQQSTEKSAKLDPIDSDALVKLLFKLKGSKQLAASDISLLENLLDLPPGRLTDLAKNGNSDDAKSRANK